MRASPGLARCPARTWCSAHAEWVNHRCSTVAERPALPSPAVPAASLPASLGRAWPPPGAGGAGVPAVHGAIFPRLPSALDWRTWLLITMRDVCPLFSVPGGRGWSVNDYVTFLQFRIPRFLLGAGASGRPDEGSLGTQTSSGASFLFLSQAKFAASLSFLPRTGHLPK